MKWLEQRHLEDDLELKNCKKKAKCNTMITTKLTQNNANIPTQQTTTQHQRNTISQKIRQDNTTQHDTIWYDTMQCDAKPYSILNPNTVFKMFWILNVS